MTKISFGYNQDYLGYGLMVEIVSCVLAIFYPLVFIPIALAGVSLFLVKTDVQFHAKEKKYRFVKSLFGVFFSGTWTKYDENYSYRLEKYKSAIGMNMRGAAHTAVRTNSYTLTITKPDGKNLEVYEFTDMQHAGAFKTEFEKAFGTKIEVKQMRFQ